VCHIADETSRYGRCGSLFCAKEGKLGDRSEAGAIQWPIHLFQDLKLRKESGAMQSSVAAAALPEQCFALITANDALGIEAPSKKVADEWWKGTYYLMKKGSTLGNIALDAEADGSTPRGNNGLPPSPAGPIEGVPAFMTRGAIFSRYFLGLAGVAKTDILLFYRVSWRHMIFCTRASFLFVWCIIVWC
jgi:hypothetical protein